MASAGCKCGPSLTAREKSTLDAVNDLLFGGERALEFRPAQTTIEKIVDLFETAAV